MNIKIHNKQIAIITSNDIIIKDTPSALDFLATVQYKTNCNNFIIKKENITEDFFNLSTRIAGDILQKFITYNIKIAIVGDFSEYTSNALKDFIYESNNGNSIFFLSTTTKALETLSKYL